MKKLISMLCIAAVSVTFSYTDIAEARNDVDEQEMNFVNNNTKSRWQNVRTSKKNKKAKKSRSHKKEKKARDKKRQRDEKIEEMDEYQRYQKRARRPENYDAETTRPKAKNKKRIHYYEDEEDSRFSANDEGLNDNGFDAEELDTSKNKQGRKHKKSKGKKRTPYYEDEIIDENIEAYTNSDSKREVVKKQKKHKKNSNNKSKKNKKKLRNRNTTRNEEYQQPQQQRQRNDWRDEIALLDKDGRVMNPRVNDSIIAANNQSETVAKHEPAIKITKGLTHNIALGTETGQLAQPKYSYKKGLKEPVKLRQELEHYRKMFARLPASDETV
ncbi:MAG: hypothetical protein K6C34_02990 [Alphaproteobacteria bacterium]|nr:hypothetical protein [Alphaproteobacteria bacterium]